MMLVSFGGKLTAEQRNSISLMGITWHLLVYESLNSLKHFCNSFRHEFMN